MARIWHRFLLCFLCLVAISGGPLAAQTNDNAGVVAEPVEDRYIIELITIGPADNAIHSRWGHTAFAVTDKQSVPKVKPGTPVGKKKKTRPKVTIYDYGIFSFDDNFLMKFLQGKPAYRIDTRSYRSMVRRYRRQNRAVFSQVLNLAAAEKEKLVSFLKWNLKPGNRFYSYDHYLHNCTTIVRDLIDRHAHGQLSGYSIDKPADENADFRSRSLDPVRNTFGLAIGMDIILNAEVDFPLNMWQDMFLPVNLMIYLDELRQAQLKENKPPLAGPIKLRSRSSFFPSWPADGELSAEYKSEVMGANFAGFDWQASAQWFVFVLFLIGAFLFPLWKPRLKFIPYIFYGGLFLFSLVAFSLGLAVSWLWSVTAIPSFQENLNVLVFSPFLGIVSAGALYSLYNLFRRRPAADWLERVLVWSIWPPLISLFLTITHIYPQANGLLAFCVFLVLYSALNVHKKLARIPL